MSQLIESHSYLNEEERSLKQQLEESIKKFFHFCDEFNQNRTQLESDVFNHFHEMRFQIDEQRERLKERIDDIAFAFIDKIKKHEVKYLNSLKVHFSSFDHNKSPEIELHKIEETFRSSNLLIETVKEMQQKQKESLKEIQFKLNEMAIVNELCEKTNTFKPNLTSFDQKEETPSFGSIRLSLYSGINSLKSEILKDERQSLEMIKLCEFSPSDKWSLLYRGTRDGFDSHDFHSKCDGHSKTLTLFKAKESSYIFGGFTTVKWKSSTNGKWKSDRNAFIFSLTNKDNQPLKMRIKANQHQYAIHCDTKYGPTFGFVGDICIANNANTPMDSFSNLGHTYSHPRHAFGTNEAQTFLAGSYDFQLDEIEVYQKE